MSSPTTSPTSTRTASRPTGRCSRNICARRRMKTISCAPTAASPSCRTAPPSTISPPAPPSRPRTRSTSRSTATPSWWCRPPAGERYTRDGGLQINNQGQLVTASGDPVLGTSGPIVFQPTDKAINIAADGNVTVLEGTGRTNSVRGKLRLVSFADAQKLVKEGGNLYSAGQGVAAQPDTTSQVAPGLHREVERQFRPRNEPHDRDHAHLHADLGACCSSSTTCTEPQSRNSPTFRHNRRGIDRCAHFTQQRPAWRHRNSTFR